jgi:hypothetical protein
MTSQSVAAARLGQPLPTRERLSSLLVSSVAPMKACMIWLLGWEA